MLSLVPSPEELAELVRFCGYCGSSPSVDAPPDLRVCDQCHLGMLLSTPKSICPDPGDTFLIIDRALNVAAVSERFEAGLRVAEAAALGHHLCEFLVPADAEPVSVERLAGALLAAASQPTTIVVRPRDKFGVRFFAELGPCGPPEGLLVKLQRA